MSRSHAAAENNELLTGLSFVLSLLAGVMLLYLIPRNYNYNHSGLALVITVLSTVLLVKIRTHNRHTANLHIGGLANLLGTSAVINFIAGTYALYIVIKSLLAGMLGGVAQSLFVHTLIDNPILPATLLSSLLITRSNDNPEARKVAEWALALTIVALLFGLYYEFLNLAPALLLGQA
jgi:cobalamin biosynthesis protein CobD/CbiB